MEASLESTLRGEHARLNAARWFLWSSGGVLSFGAALHVIVAILTGKPLVASTLIPYLGTATAAFLAVRKLRHSLSQRAVLLFFWVGLALLSWTFVVDMESFSSDRTLTTAFYIAIFALGLILGYRAAIRYAVAVAIIILVVGIIYFENPLGTSPLIMIAFLAAIPSKVVENLIEESTAEQARMNAQLRAEITVRQQAEAELQEHKEHLEVMVQQRTAELEQVNQQLQGEVVERKRAEESIRSYADELEERNEELDAFAHTVAHDLKNPLAAIIGFSDMLEIYSDKSADDTQQQCIAAIAQYSRRMDNLIHELLLLSSVRKMEEIPMAPLDMGRIVAEAAERLAYLAKERQAEISIQDEWPMVTSYGPWVEEVWVNYLSNAIKYGGESPQIKLGALEQVGPETDRPAVCFWVCDNGPGLTEEEQAGLFTPFTQLHQVNLKGHGLGLSIVRRIVPRVGGRVGVESSHGQGSTFSFVLPVETPGAGRQEFNLEHLRI